MDFFFSFSFEENVFDDLTAFRWFRLLISHNKSNFVKKKLHNSMSKWGNFLWNSSTSKVHFALIARLNSNGEISVFWYIYVWLQIIIMLNAECFVNEISAWRNIEVFRLPSGTLWMLYIYLFIIHYISCFVLHVSCLIAANILEIDVDCIEIDSRQQKYSMFAQSFNIVPCV